MCCFRVEGNTTEAGRALAAFNEVSHCYERPSWKEFPYNLYAMVHGRSLDETNGSFASLKERLAELGNSTGDAVMLISTKEYKKTSMTFYDGEC